MMGPDCGTAIVNGVSLCFANKVRQGSIGIVGASGTGSQEMSVRIHDFTGGISQLLGTGGRDLSAEVGGIMMLDAIDALEADPATTVLVVVSKPPAREVADRVLDRLAASPKPAVVCFLGASDDLIDAGAAKGVQVFNRTKPAALAAVVAAGVDESTLDLHSLNWPLIEEVRAKLTLQQRYIRGLFCGGTLCDEAMFLALEKYDDVYSNLRKDAEHKLTGTDPSKAHTFLDFGEDEFTNGKPHPMMTSTASAAPRGRPTGRRDRHGLRPRFWRHPRPVGVMLPVIRRPGHGGRRQAPRDPRLRARRRGLAEPDERASSPGRVRGLLVQHRPLSPAGVWKGVARAPSPTGKPLSAVGADIREAYARARP
jgi:succinyl-CoA synthetase alpha subunit